MRKQFDRMSGPRSVWFGKYDNQAQSVANRTDRTKALIHDNCKVQQLVAVQACLGDKVGAEYTQGMLY